MSYFSDLPIDILRGITQHLTNDELLAVSSSCRDLNQAVEEVLYEADGKDDNPVAAQWAARKGEIGTLQKIILHEAKLEGDNCLATFNTAVEMKNYEIITLMASQANQKDLRFRLAVLTALRIAMVKEDKETSFAILRGHPGDQEDLDGFFRIFFLGLSATYLEFAKLLLKKHDDELISGVLTTADVLIKRTHFFACLQFLVNRGFQGNMKAAVSRGVLWQAFVTGDVAVLNMFMADLESEINHRFYFGNTILSFAVANAKVDFVERLLREKVTRVDIRNTLTTSVIGFAYDADNKDSKTLPTTSGVMVNILAEAIKQRTDMSKEEALAVRDIWTAAENDDLATVRELIEVNGYAADLKDRNGATPLARAASKQCIKVVNYLVRLDGIDIHLADNENKTPLTRAAETNNDLVVNPMLGLEGKTLQWMTSAIRDAVLQDLAINGITNLRKVYDLLRAASPPETAVIYKAAAEEDVSVVFLLLSAVVTGRSEVVVSVLVIAAFFGKVHLLEELIDFERPGINGRATLDAMKFLSSYPQGGGAEKALEGWTISTAAIKGGYPDLPELMTVLSEPDE